MKRFRVRGNVWSCFLDIGRDAPSIPHLAHAIAEDPVGNAVDLFHFVRLFLNGAEIGRFCGTPLLSRIAKTRETMSEQTVECVESSMKPYVDDYQSRVDGVMQRQKSLLAELASLTEGGASGRG